MFIKIIRIYTGLIVWARIHLVEAVVPHMVLIKLKRVVHSKSIIFLGNNVTTDKHVIFSVFDSIW